MKIINISHMSVDILRLCFVGRLHQHGNMKSSKSKATCVTVQSLQARYKYSTNISDTSLEYAKVLCQIQGNYCASAGLLQ